MLLLGGDVRPTDHLRLNLSYNDSRVYRPDDGSRVLRQDVAVGTLEYQLSRAFQLCVIGQYSTNARDSLHDDTRALVFVAAAGVSGQKVPSATGVLRRMLKRMSLIGRMRRIASCRRTNTESCGRYVSIRPQRVSRTLRASTRTRTAPRRRP